jgi:hypothetical protein
MNLLVDSIVFGFFIFFFITGMIKGFIRTVIGPIALLVGCAVSWLYFQRTQNFLVSILISLMAPFIINLVVLAILKAHREVNDETEGFFTLGRLAGGVFNLLWGGSMVVLTVALLLFIPGEWESLKWTQAEIKSSLTYSILNSLTYSILNSLSGGKISQGSQKLEHTIQALRDPEVIHQLQEAPEYNAVMEDKKIQDIFNDEGLVKDLRESNFTRIINNEKIRALLEDPELVNKMLQLHKYISDTPAEKKKSGPKVINVK